MRSCLNELSSGRGRWSEFSVTYNDLHGLHGGLTLTIYGDGRVEQEAVRTKVRDPRHVSREDLDRLVALLRELQAWEQRVPERDAVPDESRCQLTCRCGAAETTIWEYPGEDRSWHEEHAHLLDCVRTGAEPCGSLGDALAALRVVESVYEQSGLKWAA